MHYEAPVLAAIIVIRDCGILRDCNSCSSLPGHLGLTGLGPVFHVLAGVTQSF